VVDLAAAELDQLHEPIADRFGAEPQERMRAFVLGLPRVNCWSIAGHAG
jgi:hypothetical protein